MRLRQVLMRQAWVDSETMLTLLKKISAMTDYIGSPHHLDRYESTELDSVMTLSFLENELRMRQTERFTQWAELLRPAVRHREHWGFHPETPVRRFRR